MEREITIYKNPGEGLGISMDTRPDRGHVSSQTVLYRMFFLMRKSKIKAII